MTILLFSKYIFVSSCFGSILGKFTKLTVLGLKVYSDNGPH